MINSETGEQIYSRRFLEVLRVGDVNLHTERHNISVKEP